MMKDKGFTLVELVVVMGMFVIIMLVISSSFEKILQTAGHQVKSAETSTEGIVGLEMLRSDLEHAGFGLFWHFPPTYVPTSVYNEMTDSPVSGVDYEALKDSKPRAVVVRNTPAGGAYLVIKSTRVALHDTAKKWSYVDYLPAEVRSWGGAADDFVAGETVITLNNTFTTAGAPDKILAMKSSDNSWYYACGNPPVQPPDIAFKPGDASQLFVAYGVDPGGSTLRMPYNRADYYIRRPAPNDANYKIPESCNPGTGILFKGVVRQSDGKIAEYPLLNCVADMQVDFELGSVDNNSTTSPFQAQLFTGDASDIRDQLKNVYVSILAQEGKKDRNYSYPNDTIQVGNPGTLRNSAWMSTTFGTDWRNYRWKVYTIAVHLKNLD